MGGGPCVVIIEGQEALAAVDRYDADRTIHPKADTAQLRHQIEASCTLSYYLSLYAAAESEEVKQSDFAPVIEFHKRVAAGLRSMTATEIEAAGRELKAVNLALAEKYSEEE
jgi:hypothetical protein